MGVADLNRSLSKSAIEAHEEAVKELRCIWELRRKWEHLKAINSAPPLLKPT